MSLIFLFKYRENGTSSDSRVCVCVCVCVCVHVHIHACVSLSLGQVLNKCAYFFLFWILGGGEGVCGMGGLPGLHIFFPYSENKCRRKIILNFASSLSPPQRWWRWRLMRWKRDPGSSLLESMTYLPTWKWPVCSAGICSRCSINNIKVVWLET